MVPSPTVSEVIIPFLMVPSPTVSEAIIPFQMVPSPTMSEVIIPFQIIISYWFSSRSCEDGNSHQDFLNERC